MTSILALLRRPSGVLPLVMSAAALGMVAWDVALWGTTSPPSDVRNG
jgi:hypothetical protein